MGRDDPASVRQLLEQSSNWRRWGSDDQVGAANLITPEKTVAATRLVKTGRSVSLSRPFPTAPAANNPRPAQQMTSYNRKRAIDYYGIDYHGRAATHVDALCHMLNERGQVWNGRAADEIFTSYGAMWGGIEHWSAGLITRGVFLDVPRHRGDPYVTQENPVTGQELLDVTNRQGVDIEPGDAVVVYSGRDRWDVDHPVWGSDMAADGTMRRPGLDASCLRFLREKDCSVLAWDMMDAQPNIAGDEQWDVHSAIYAFGLALVDNCELSELSSICRREGTTEFLFILAPLVVCGGTGSPVNPLAIL